MIASSKMSRDSGRIVAGGVDNGSPTFILKAFFEATFSFSDILKITFSTLNHVNHIRRFTSNVRLDLIHLSSTIKSILRAAIFDIRAETDHEAKRDDLYFVPINPAITSTDGIRKSVRIKEVSALGDIP